ncbi:restriction endonuclease subunit S [Aeromonas allosaccharophila]|uniref:restriction endonuclease subunit S n=1 Tax=Aeromonas allosaccharophila TaxID=656 RepID=UPI002B493153|nr:restriction endonuclease subunit S [Aeromonas allosaccharophila]
MAEQMMQHKAAKQTIPAGYKQTEVGVIPEDWTVYDLPDVIWYQEGPGLRKWQFKPTGLKVINVTNLQDNGVLDLDKTERHISWDEFEKTYKHFICDAGDLVIASSGNSYCKSSIVRACDLPLLMNTSVIRFKPINAFSKGYMDIYLRSQSFKNQIDLLITGGAQPNFGPAHLNKIKIPAPTDKYEQTAIANVLSDSDALIGTLEQLIAKKQAIKTATMQQLLTGRTRLPQFALRPDGTPKGYKSSELGKIPEDWGINSINKVGSIITGSTPPTAVDCYWDGDIPWITPTDIGDAKNIFESERRITEKGLQAIRGLPANSVLVTCIASIGKNAILKNAGACNQQINAVVPTALFDVDFLYYNIEFSKERLRQCAGITATPIISKALFSDFLLPFPSNKEQTAIATILSDMDSELNALEQKLAKARDLKQGMMQQLLTGRIRLPLEVGV